MQLKSDGLANSREAFHRGSGRRKSQMISDQNLGNLLYLGDDIYWIILAIIYHSKDPYEQISIIECHKGFACYSSFGCKD